MDKYNLKLVLSDGLLGLTQHEQALEKKGKQALPELFRHFDDQSVTVNLFATDWIISCFLSFIPIEYSSVYLTLFFEKGWEVFYDVAIELLRFY